MMPKGEGRLISEERLCLGRGALFVVALRGELHSNFLP